MRLEPIEKPNGLKLRVLYGMMRKQLGKTPTPIKVLSARMPISMKVTTVLYKIEKKLSLDDEIKHLIEYFTSSLNGCTFCMDIGRTYLVRADHKLEKFDSIMQYQTSGLFSDGEKAALAYAEEIVNNRKVSDETFEELKRHFGEQEIVEITYLVAMQTFTNLGNIALGIESDGLCEIALHSKNAGKSKDKGVKA